MPTTPERHPLTSTAAALAAATAALLAVALPAAAQGTWQDQVASQLDASPTVGRLRGEGYAVSHGTFYELAQRGTRRSLRLTLDGGRRYEAVGKCDNDCSDLDLRLYDENDRLVDSDVLSDATPIVAVTPRHTATYRLEVDMHACRTPTCGWGAVVLGSAGGGSRTPTWASNRPRPVPEAPPASNAPWRDQVDAQLARSGLLAAARRAGYAPAYETIYALGERASRRSTTLRLEAGRSYRVLGTCDHDCADLDFRLYDEHGRLVDSDIGPDDVPVVSVTPQWTAHYRLEVTPAACSMRLCGWGAMVLAR